MGKEIILRMKDWEKLDRMIGLGNYQYAGGIGPGKFYGKRISE